MKELLALTVENLNAKNACAEGMAWITPILEGEGGATEARRRLVTEKRDWWYWAAERGFDVTSDIAETLKEAGLCQVVSNSGNYGSASNSGYRGSASNSGDYGSASNSGDYGSASNSGDCGSASNSGDCGSASNSGYRGSASNSGYRGSAAGLGLDSRVQGLEIGSCLICAYWEGKFARVAVGNVGEDGIEPGVWYSADPTTGKLKRAANQEDPKTGPEAGR